MPLYAPSHNSVHPFRNFAVKYEAGNSFVARGAAYPKESFILMDFPWKMFLGRHKNKEYKEYHRSVHKIHCDVWKCNY